MRSLILCSIVLASLFNVSFALPMSKRSVYDGTNSRVNSRFIAQSSYQKTKREKPTLFSVQESVNNTHRSQFVKKMAIPYNHRVGSDYTVRNRKRDLYINKRSSTNLIGSAAQTASNVTGGGSGVFSGSGEVTSAIKTVTAGGEGSVGDVPGMLTGTF